MSKRLSQIFLGFLALAAFALFFVLGLKGGTQATKPGHILPAKAVNLDLTTQAANSLLPGSGLPSRAAASEQDSLEDGLKKCLGVQLQGGIEIYIAGLIVDPDVHHEVLLHNIHLETKDGRQLRIQALGPSGDTQSMNPTEVRLFTVDAENLPVRADLPAELQALKPAQQWAQLQKMGRQIFEQKKEIFHKKDGLSLRIEWRDGNLFEIYWMGSKASFACSASRCDCLQP